jgi:transposase
MTLHPNALGVDIAKRHLDVFCPRCQRAQRIANAPAAIATLIAQHQDAFFVFEATSGCDETLRHLLAQAKVPFARINPRRAREFARLTGVVRRRQHDHQGSLGCCFSPADRPSVTDCAELLGA